MVTIRRFRRRKKSWCRIQHVEKARYVITPIFKRWQPLLRTALSKRKKVNISSLWLRKENRVKCRMLWFIKLQLYISIIMPVCIKSFLATFNPEILICNENPRNRIILCHLSKYISCICCFFAISTFCLLFVVFLSFCTSAPFMDSLSLLISKLSNFCCCLSVQIYIVTYHYNCKGGRVESHQSWRLPASISNYQRSWNKLAEKGTRSFFFWNESFN